MKRSALPFVCGRQGPGAEVPDAELAAGERVDGGAVAGAVVGQHALDPDAVAGDRRRGRGGGSRPRSGLLVGEDLGVGEPAVVVDGDVDVLPADRPRRLPCRRCRWRSPCCAAAEARWPAPPSIRPSFLTSMWTSSPGRERS